jgi:hypothetical protein
MKAIERLAPTGDAVVDYDRRHLALYAALLEANEVGGDWQDAASLVMCLDITDREAEACWRSHLERARWIIGAGLATAVAAFNVRRPSATAE